MWDIVKSETAKDVSCDAPLQLEINKHIINDISDIANEFNQYFLNAANVLVNKTCCEWLLSERPFLINFLTCSLAQSLHLK